MPDASTEEPPDDCEREIPSAMAMDRQPHDHEDDNMIADHDQQLANGSAKHQTDHTCCSPELS